MLKTIACALALAAALPAVAAESEVRNEVVRFDDLNLASPAGIATLERRIASAARRVCGYNETYGTYIVSREIAECMDNALASARKGIAAKTGAAVLKG